MFRQLVCLVVALGLLSGAHGFDFVEGSSYNGRCKRISLDEDEAKDVPLLKVHSQKFEYAAYPLLTRTKDFFYNDPGQNPIKSIQAIDLDHSQATVRITAGGIGQPYVNLRFESERSSGLNYQIDVYV